MRRDGSLSYCMRNVFIQLDSYHNLPMMNERPLCEDGARLNEESSIGRSH